MTVQTIARQMPRLVGSLTLLALLGACAGKPPISAQIESSQYRTHAGRNYTPPGPASDPWGPYISEAAAKYDVPDRWIREVMRQESGGRLYGRNGDLVTSGAGAMGLMQVMPGTYDELRARYSELGDDPYDPHNNILAGTAYIREMFDIYGSPGFLAAYNAGPGRLDDYLTRNRVLPEETRRYVANIGPRLVGEPNRPSPGAQYAMNNLPMAVPSGSRYAGSSRYSAPTSFASAAPIAPVSSAPVFSAPAFSAPVGPAIVLNPQPYVQLAAAPILAPALAPVAPVPQAGGNYIVLRPQPVEVAEAPPARPTAAPVQIAQLPEPPRPSQAPSFAQAPFAPMQFAQLPEPPRPVPFRDPPRSQQQMAAATLVPVAPRGFGLVTPANAEPIGPRHAGSPAGGWGGGSWAVQVGAFANEGLAASANVSAKDHARDLLGPARGTVTALRQPHGTLYRARLTGLSRDGAAQACERLSRARSTCMVISPDAQS